MRIGNPHVRFLVAAFGIAGSLFARAAISDDFKRSLAAAESAHTPIAVFWGNTECDFCNTMMAAIEGTADAPSAVPEWLASHGVTLVVKHEDPDSKDADFASAKAWIKGIDKNITKYPFVGFSWRKADGTEVQAAFPGRLGLMPDKTGETLEAQFVNSLEMYFGEHSGGDTPEPEPDPESEPEPAPAIPETTVEIVEPSEPFVAPSKKAVMLGAILAEDGSVAGIAQVDVGKASKKGESKVSLTLVGLDGRKRSSKAVTIPSGDGLQEVVFEVRGYGAMTLALGADGFVGEGADLTVVSVKDEAVTGEATAMFVPAEGFAMDGLLAEHLPTDVKVRRTAKKWTLPKAGTLRYVKPNAKKGIEGGLVAAGENVAGLKLAYSANAGTLKGSFKLWTFDEEKKRLRSVSVSVTGVVVGGVGYCEATYKKRKIGEFSVK